MVVKTLLDLLNIGIEVWLGYWLFDVPSCRRFQKRWTVVLEYIMFLGMPGGMVLLNRLAGIRFANGMWIFQMIAFVTAAIIFTKYKVMKSLAWASVYFVTVSVAELPGLMLDGWINQRPYMESVFSDYIYSYIYNSFLTVFLIVVTALLGTWIRRQLKFVFCGKINILWILFSDIEYLFIVFFQFIGFSETGGEFFLFGIMLTVSVLLLIVVIFVLQAYRQAEKSNYLSRIRDMEIDMAYEKFKSAYEYKSKLLHDFKYQLMALHNFLDHKEYEQGRQFLEEISQSMNSNKTENQIWTGHPIADAVLSAKMKQAKIQGINVEQDIQRVDIALSDRDFCILLGNLLDNAIEAAEQVKDSQPWIRIQIKSKMKMVWICIENRIAHQPVIKNGVFISSKKDQENHGWGMRSVQSIVTQNQGQMDYHYDQSVFTVNIEFFG